jgi:hypothetical protein
MDKHQSNSTNIATERRDKIRQMCRECVRQIKASGEHNRRRAVDIKPDYPQTRISPERSIHTEDHTDDRT